MPDRFSISYEITRVNCSSIRPNPNHGDYEGFMLNIADGKAVLSFGDQSISTPLCALLWLSRSLINLCTAPVLFGTEVRETVMETSMSLHSTYSQGNIVLASYIKRECQSALEIPLNRALQGVGAFHRNLLTDLFERCPTLRTNDLLLVRIPFGFGIKHIQHFKSIAPE